MKKIQMTLEDALRLFHLMEETMSFFHQPAHYNVASLEDFAKKYNPEIHYACFKIMRECFAQFPKDIQEKIEDGWFEWPPMETKVGGWKKTEQPA
jgi:oligoribonuclease (3'-5' exoribonuclease)